jgi:DNA-binding beta-propeller fold protein YncE
MLDSGHPAFLPVEQDMNQNFWRSAESQSGQPVTVRILSASLMVTTIIFVTIGLAISARGDLFVSAAGHNSVMRFDETTGTFLGNFMAPNAGGLSNPQGIAFGPDGHLYVASEGSDNVLRFDGQTGLPMGVFASVPGGDLAGGNQFSRRFSVHE